MKKNAKGLLVSALATCAAACACVGVTGIPAKADASLADLAAEGFTMEKGAAVRITAPIGLRFEADVTESTFDAIKEAFPEAQFGMVIIPADLVGGNIDLTKITFGAESYLGTQKIVDIKYGTLANLDKDEELDLQGAIVNLIETNIDRAFIGLAYVTDGTNYVPAKYAENDVKNSTRRMSEVAAAAIASGDYDQTVVTV